MLLWIILYAIIIFNSLVHTRQMANEAWSGIDVQLKRRSELVPNLVEAVKGYVGHERSVLEDVTRLRGAARSLPANDVTGRAQAEGALSLAHRPVVVAARHLKLGFELAQLLLQLKKVLTRLEI